jgi:hypothetical protein
VEEVWAALELQGRRGSFSRTIFDAGEDVYVAWGGQASEGAGLQLLGGYLMRLETVYLAFAAACSEGDVRDDGHVGPGVLVELGSCKVCLRPYRMDVWGWMDARFAEVDDDELDNLEMVADLV